MYAKNFSPIPVGPKKCKHLYFSLNIQKYSSQILMHTFRNCIKYKKYRKIYKTFSRQAKIISGSELFSSLQIFSILQSAHIGLESFKSSFSCCSKHFSINSHLQTDSTPENMSNTSLGSLGLLRVFFFFQDNNHAHYCVIKLKRCGGG